MGLRFGVMTLQAPPYADLAERWRRAEALGWDSIWVADHTPAQFPGTIAFEAYALLGALARETSRVRIGALVTPIAFRNPTMLAMSAITVDHISGGRLEVGIGAGGGDKDAAALGMEIWSPADADKTEIFPCVPTARSTFPTRGLVPFARTERPPAPEKQESRATSTLLAFNSPSLAYKRLRE